MPIKVGISVDSENMPLASKQHIDNCCFASWYPQYRRIVPKCKVLTPPEAFVKYLHEDGIKVPSDGYTWSTVDNEEGEDVTEETDNVEDSDQEIIGPFAEFHSLVGQTIKDLGGSVTPKLNWSAPKDALWISTTNSLKCVSPTDIYLLLKASSYISHDLNEAYTDCTDFDASEKTPEKHYLVLRQWFNVNPALEFRCFVKERRLVAISQRDMNFYDYLHPMSSKISAKIEALFEEHLKSTFPDSCFVFDVYFTQSYDKVYLMDINAFSRKTDTLLYSWDQIIDAPKSGRPMLRLLEPEDASRAFGAREHTENSIPADFVEASLSGDINELARQIQELMAKEERSGNDSDTGSDSDSDSGSDSVD